MICYYKGSYVKHRVELDISGPAFKFGAGFFETLFYNGNIICHLDAHIARIVKSLETYRIPYERVDFEQVITKVLKQNKLIGRHGRINIYYVLEAGSAPASPLIAVYPYTVDENRTFRLCISPYHHQSHLCRHKTMNYMHYYLALADARRREFDDALLVDQAGQVLETCSASLVFSDGESFFTPAAEGRLPGIAADKARSVIPIGERAVTIENLQEFKYVYVLNSLIGIKPVILIDDLAYPPDWGTCLNVTGAVLCA